MKRIKYIIKQAFRTKNLDYTNKIEDEPAKRLGIGETITAGIHYNLSDNILNSKEYKYYFDKGMIEVIEEKILTDIKTSDKNNTKTTTTTISETASINHISETQNKKLNI